MTRRVPPSPSFAPELDTTHLGALARAPDSPNKEAMQCHACLWTPSHSSAADSTLLHFESMSPPGLAAVRPPVARVRFLATATAASQTDRCGMGRWLEAIDVPLSDRPSFAFVIVSFRFGEAFTTSSYNPKLVMLGSLFPCFGSFHPAWPRASQYDFYTLEQGQSQNWGQPARAASAFHRGRSRKLYS